MHTFGLSVQDDDSTLIFDDVRRTITYNRSDIIHFDVQINDIHIYILFTGYCTNICFSFVDINVVYYVKPGDCEFQLNDDLTIIGKCHGVVCCSWYDLFTSERIPSQEIIENFIENFIENSMCYPMFEKYDNDIYMQVLYINKFSGNVYALVYDKFGHSTYYYMPDGEIHVFIKYDHGQLECSITPPTPSQKHTKPAPHGAVDDAAE